MANVRAPAPDRSGGSRAYVGAPCRTPLQRREQRVMASERTGASRASEPQGRPAEPRRGQSVLAWISRDRVTRLSADDIDARLAPVRSYPHDTLFAALQRGAARRAYVRARDPDRSGSLGTHVRHPVAPLRCSSVPPCCARQPLLRHRKRLSIFCHINDLGSLDRF